MGSVGAETADDYDVLIIGAGLSGICTLIHMRERFPSWRIKVVEAGPEVGGTWYFNSYPGARFDSESLSYGYSFDKELLDTWHWKEYFSPQPQTLKYIQHVADKHDLRKDIKFDTQITRATWQDHSRTWFLNDQSNNGYRTRFFVSCMGFLSKSTLPRVPGIEDFRGQLFHTSQWPKDFDLGRDFGNKSVGIIGTGATGIQTITAISKESSIKSISVFQRTANWSAPLRNFEITPEQMEKYKTQYDSVFQRCKMTPMGFIHEADPRKTSQVTHEEIIALWDKIYAEPGFGKWLGAFSDTYTDRAANKLYSDYMAKKIRARVHDPATAEKLIPKNHGFGTRRVPLESGYFEVYNQPNVHLIDLQENAIEKITQEGILTSDGKEHKLDILICATGFDAITGAFSAIDWLAKDGRPLLGSSHPPDKSNAIWLDHRPRTYLGITVPALPNTFMVLGPHQPFGNATRSIEHAVEVIVDLLAFIEDKGYTYVEPTEKAVDEWTDHVVECSKGALSNEIDSWMTGVNKNVEGKQVRSIARYAGSAVAYRKKCSDCKASGWRGLTFA